MNAYRFAGVAGSVWLVLSLAVAAQAADLTLSLEYVGSFDEAFVDIGTPLQEAPALSDPVAATDMHQFNVYMTLDGAAASEDFASVYFGVQLSAGMTPTANSPWGPNNPSYQPPGSPPPPIPIFLSNDDGGDDPDDLQHIVVVAHPTVAAAVEPGESGPYLLGSFWTEWDQLAASTVTVSVVPSFWSTYVDGVQTDQSPMTVHGDTMTFTVVPEPASIALAGLAIVGLLALRRRG